jgi:hypothetical protein
MTWNYRVVHRHYPEWDEHTWAIYEVFYDDDGKPDAVTSNHVGCFGNTLEEMIDDLTHYCEALADSVLEWDDIVTGEGTIMIELDQDMKAKAAEEGYDYEPPVSDVRRVHVQTHQEPRCREDEGAFWESVGGHYALVPWDEWEQALELQAEYDRLADDYNYVCDKRAEEKTHEGMDCYVSNEELERLNEEIERLEGLLAGQGKQLCVNMNEIARLRSEERDEALELAEERRAQLVDDIYKGSFNSTAGDPQGWTLNASYDIPENF